jgi:hypothetical protein
MTPPPAATTAARSRRPDRPAAFTPRRSAPARARQATRTRPRPARPSKGLPRARRVSGPVRAAAAAQRVLPTLRPLPVLGTIGSHAARAGRSLPDSPVLDRLLRGRVWIGLLGTLLIGLVAINVSLLKYNAEAGRNAEKAKALRIQNAELRARVSRLRSSDRLERAGRALGLGMPAAGQVRYLSARRGDGRAAAKTLRSSVWAEFQAPAMDTQTAQAELVPAVPGVTVAPTGTTGPATPTTAAPTTTTTTVPGTAPVAPAAETPVQQTAPAPPAGGTAPSQATATPLANQPSQTTGG